MENRIDKIYAHVFVGERKWWAGQLPCAPRAGDVIRLSNLLYVKVREVTWCLDEPHPLGLRVNIATKKV